MNRPVANTPSTNRVLSQLLSSDMWLRKDRIFTGTWRPDLKGDGSMTLSAITVKDASYIYLPDLKVCYINLAAGFTTGGVASSRVFFTLPYPCRFTNIPFAGSIYDGSLYAAHIETNSDKGALVGITRYDNTNYSLAAGKLVFVSGLYLTA